MLIHAKKRCQASFEYLVIIAIALIILIPMIYMFQRYTIQSADTIQQNKIRAIGEDMVNTAETVYYMGYPARLTIQEDFPGGITGLNLTTDWSQNVNIITFNISGRSEFAYYCNVNINASFNESYYSPGLKNFLFETKNSSQGNFVQISMR